MAASGWGRKRRRKRRASPNLQGEASALDGERIGSSQDEYEKIDWSAVGGAPGEWRLSVSAVWLRSLQGERAKCGGQGKEAITA